MCKRWSLTSRENVWIDHVVFGVVLVLLICFQVYLCLKNNSEYNGYLARRVTIQWSTFFLHAYVYRLTWGVPCLWRGPNKSLRKNVTHIWTIFSNIQIGYKINLFPRVHKVKHNRSLWIQITYQLKILISLNYHLPYGSLRVGCLQTLVTCIFKPYNFEISVHNISFYMFRCSFLNI